jgi:hypothetical protein
MLTPELQKIAEMYASLMNEVKLRNRLAGDLYYSNLTLGLKSMDHEVIAMIFRKIAELMIFANLVGHEKEYAALHASMGKEWNMGRLMDRIKAINPAYYPVALTEVVNSEGIRTGVEDLPEGTWMTEDELKAMYGKCSDLIHALNPFGVPPDLTEYITLFDNWGNRLNNLLSHHAVLLANGIHVVRCIMNEKGESEPQVTIHEPSVVDGILILNLLS